METTGDRGDIVLGWLTRVVVVLALLGVVGFDVVSLLSARVTAEDHARTAVRAAAASYEASRVPQAAYDAALGEVVAFGDSIDAPTFTTAPDGTVTLTLRRQAPTLLLERIPPLRDWALVTTTVQGRPAA